MRAIPLGAQLLYAVLARTVRSSDESGEGVSVGR
jgi:hypothetical protein